MCLLDISAVPRGKSQSLFSAMGCRNLLMRLLSLVPRGGMLEQ